MTVTHSPKCYVSVCVGCDLLFQTSRKDQLTCSTACRVRAHRNGSVEALRVVAMKMKIPPALLQRCKAVDRLLPHETTRLIAGEVEVDDLQERVGSAFFRLLLEVVDG